VLNLPCLVTVSAEINLPGHQSVSVPGL